MLKAQICLAIVQIKITWFIHSPYKPQIWHLVSTFIPMSMRLSATGRASLTAFQRNNLIFGAVDKAQMCSLIPLRDGRDSPLTKAYFLTSLSASQCPDLTEYSPDRV